jgi:hypothetical protein
VKKVTRAAATATAAAMLLTATSASATITFLGSGSIPGDATDQSGLAGLLEDGVTPRNQAGGFGSAIAYTGYHDLYVATPDRGPADGTTSYLDRLYTINVAVKRERTGSYSVKPAITGTRLMRAGQRAYFTGSAAAFDATNSSGSLRLDPEGLRASSCGDTIFVSDEYGPFLYEFSLESGKHLRSIPLPNKYLIDFPSADPAAELARNASGRQANRGMEGLAISPDGNRLYGIMQSPLLQDGGLDGAAKRVGTNVRIVEVGLASGAIREFLYQLDDKGYGVSEILAVNEQELLVLERDGKAGASAVFKRIFLISTAGATDLRGIASLPQAGAPVGMTPVAKSLFLDLLDPAYGLAGPTFPEKVEGMAFGPDLDDGRRLLLITNDNDFVATQPSNFYAFAIGPSDLPGFQAQRVSHRDGECRRDQDDR